MGDLLRDHLSSMEGHTMTVALDCANISFRYDKKKPILKGVSFQIEQGSIYGCSVPTAPANPPWSRYCSG